MIYLAFKKYYCAHVEWNMVYKVNLFMECLAYIILRCAVQDSSVSIKPITMIYVHKWCE